VRFIAVYRVPNESREIARSSRAKARKLRAQTIERQGSSRASHPKVTTCRAEQTWKLRSDKHISSFVYIAREIIRISEGGCYARDPAKTDKIGTSGRVDSGYRPGAVTPANA